jgi:hypothetical protein
MFQFLEREAGHLAVLSLLTTVGVVLYCFTRDKFLVEFFGAALLLAMRGRSSSGDAGK